MGDVKRVAAAVVIASASAAGWLACSTFGSASDVAQPPDAHAAETGDDAPQAPLPPPPPSPSDADVDGGLPDGTIFFDSFESGNCGAWIGHVGITTPFSEGHTGTHSCMLCATMTGSSYATRAFVPPAADAGELYELTYYIKRTDAGPATLPTAVIDLYYPDASTDTFYGQGQALSTLWVEVQAKQGSTAADPSSADTRVQFEATSGDCVLFDDVRLVHYRP